MQTTAKKVVLVTGGFDPVHSGHLAYFEEAKKLGHQLWVGVNSDLWLTQKKGQPFMPFKERAKIVESLKFVDRVLDFEDDALGSASHCIEKALKLMKEGVGETDESWGLVFANGGDRGAANCPELDRWGQDVRVEFQWGVGGVTKMNSSSWLLKDWKQPITQRQWGWYRVLDQQFNFKVKELVIQPGQRLSMQRHGQRAEHWYVLRGQCQLRTEWQGQESLETLEPLTKGRVIRLGEWHQASNEGESPCHVLEVQYGSACVEEDIERRAMTQAKLTSRPPNWRSKTK
jgi:cytidyltransferase-like protein